MKINSNYKLREVAGETIVVNQGTAKGLKVEWEANETIYLMQGTVNVIKATLANE
jgi:hypothetical protein